MSGTPCLAERVRGVVRSVLRPRWSRRTWRSRRCARAGAFSHRLAAPPARHRRVCSWRFGRSRGLAADTRARRSPSRPTARSQLLENLDDLNLFSEFPPRSHLRAIPANPKARSFVMPPHPPYPADGPVATIPSPGFPPLATGSADPCRYPATFPSPPTGAFPLSRRQDSGTDACVTGYFPDSSPRPTIGRSPATRPLRRAKPNSIPGFGRSTRRRVPNTAPQSTAPPRTCGCDPATGSTSPVPT